MEPVILIRYGLLKYYIHIFSTTTAAGSNFVASLPIPGFLCLFQSWLKGIRIRKMCMSAHKSYTSKGCIQRSTCHDRLILVKMIRTKFCFTQTLHSEYYCNLPFVLLSKAETLVSITIKSLFLLH